MSRIYPPLLFFIALVISHQNGIAGLMTFTNRTAFDSQLSSLSFTSAVLDFESQTAGQSVTSGNSIGGITFSYNFGATSLMVSNLYPTTSGQNQLGTDDPGELLQDGDDISLSFSARSAVGLYIISADVLLANDFTLQTISGAASLDPADVQSTLADGSKVYFLGLIDDTSTFSTVDLVTHGPGGAFLYNIDDIVFGSANLAAVPEPGSLVALSLCGMCYWANKRRIRRTSTRITAS